MSTKNKGELSASQTEELIRALKERFEKNTIRHKDLKWPDIEQKLLANPTKIWALHQMEATGGEPDVAGFDPKTKEYIFYDCSPETPAGRRSFCYDQQALDSRKANKPENSAISKANEMGIELLSEQQYHELQQLGNFDLKTSSWIQTPADIRKLGGAIFGDNRFGRVFIYHNGADSYYAARGFRGLLRV